MTLTFSDMVELETICPYTGLRSFTEDESLYFKGREEHILQITALLEEKKFLMVTGASGDGKSSLIFAGLIPQARAGFFKSKYSNWYIADFRPERSPLKNMAQSLAAALELEHPPTAEVELSRGFSSLAELYKSSDRFIDTESEQWKSTSEEDRGKKERRAGNLLILIDQFEEFFTNPENFPGGVPSQDSRLLLNIILETVKISLKENLPIYVVCTMRSDYIGQCAAFRGLPEFIGFSQFFVPRLQRKELHQVIEEPAILSGNRISNRLIDRLIFDLEEGTDQLPILQHALKQIWKAADSGREEMDLLHYAMVGGMAGDKLPKENIDRFVTWKEGLNDYEKTYLEKPGLANVLDIHANQLYEGAAAYYNRKGKQEITPKQARFIIAMSFACLTRIDESRAVRNRMTLEEITRIINVPQFTVEVVGGVLDVFREPENTLIRPFISEDGGEQAMKRSTVIDITHEALIRNWKLLKKWANQEYEYYVTFQDFQQQVNRWIGHGKSEDFLLSIGPLTYFENWYKNCRPNQYWINRYNHSEDDVETRLQQSNKVLRNGKDFLRKSSLRLFLTRTFMKYGAGRIGLVTGLVAMIVAVSAFIYQWRTQQNDYVLNRILEEGEVLLGDKEVISFSKGFFTADAERLRPGFFKHAISVLAEQQKIDVAINVFLAFALTDLNQDPPIMVQSIFCADSLIKISGAKLDSTDAHALNTHINNLNGVVRNESYYLFSKDNDRVRSLRDNTARSQARLVTKILVEGPPKGRLDMKAFHLSSVDALNHKGFTESDMKSIIESLSPLETNDHARQRFEVLFPSGENITQGFSQSLPYNGGYQLLAYLYASTGNVRMTLRCLEVLKTGNPNYDKAFINSMNVSAYFLMYGHEKDFREFVKAYAKSLGIPALDYLKEMLNFTGVMRVDNSIRFLNRGNTNDNITFFNAALRNQLFAFARELSQIELKTPDALNFNLALLCKLEGVLIAKSDKAKNILGNNKPDSLFRAAVAHYSRVSPRYLDENIDVQLQTFQITTERRTIARRQLFLYPDQLKTVEAFIQPRWFRFYGVAFFNFLIKEDLFSQLYKGQEDYELIINWINSYFGLYGQIGQRSFLNYPKLAPSTFLTLDSLITRSGYDLDGAWIKLVLIQHYFTVGDTANAYRLAGALKFKEFEKVNFEDAPPFHNYKIIVAGELAVRGKRKESLAIVRRFSATKNRVSAYAKLAANAQRHQKIEEAQYYLDSAKAELKRVKNFNSTTRDFRLPLVEVLSLSNDKASRKQALEYVGSMPWFDRLFGVATMVWSYAQLDEYHKAFTAVPNLASVDDRLFLYDYILAQENIKRGNDSGEWKPYYRVISSENDYTYFQNDLITE